MVEEAFLVNFKCFHCKSHEIQLTHSLGHFLLLWLTFAFSKLVHVLYDHEIISSGIDC